MIAFPIVLLMIGSVAPSFGRVGSVPAGTFYRRLALIYWTMKFVVSRFSSLSGCPKQLGH